MATLGAEVGLADEKMTAICKRNFNIMLVPSSRGNNVPSHWRSEILPRQSLPNFLRSPNGMRQAIIASEILRRPEI